MPTGLKEIATMVRRIETRHEDMNEAQLAAYQRDAMQDHMHVSCGAYASIFERLKFQVEEHSAEERMVNGALKTGRATPILLRRAVSLSRSRERMSDTARFLVAVHNERPFIKV